MSPCLFTLSKAVTVIVVSPALTPVIFSALRGFYHQSLGGDGHVVAIFGSVETARIGKTPR